MLITVAIIALMALVSVLGITYCRRSILPSDTELFIDVTSTFADGKSDTKTDWTWLVRTEARNITGKMI